MFRAFWPPSVPSVLGRDSAEPGRGRVLVVDDDPALREMYKRSLGIAGFDVVIAANGPDGLQKLREDRDIRLVILDLNMPEVDGWAFRDTQRQDPAMRDVPTVIITGAPIAEVVSKELHATQYMMKPVKRDHLISVVSEYCEPLVW